MGLFRKSKSIDFGVISSIIGRDAEVKGEINSKGTVRIDGTFEGKVTAKGDVFIGEQSKMSGNIIGGRVVVSGEVNGNIIAADGLEVSRTGRVYGDITGDKLIIDEGAVYKGKVNMESAAKRSERAGATIEEEIESARAFKTIKAA